MYDPTLSILTEDVGLGLFSVIVIFTAKWTPVSWNEPFVVYVTAVMCSLLSLWRHRFLFSNRRDVGSDSLVSYSLQIMPQWFGVHISPNKIRIPQSITYPKVYFHSFRIHIHTDGCWGVGGSVGWGEEEEECRLCTEQI